MHFSSVPIRRISLHEPAIVASRYGLTNVLLVAFLAALIAGGWYLWIVIAITVLIGGVADELAGDDRQRLSAAARWYYEANLYATLPLISLITFVYLHYLTTADPLGSVQGLARLGVPFAASPSSLGTKIGATLGLGIFYGLAAVTVGHELIHRRRSWIGFATGRALLAFTFNTSFAITHLLHHRHVGTQKDAATARRGESVFEYAVRSIFEGPPEAFSHEAKRLRRKGLRPWTWRNRALRGHCHLVAIAVSVISIAGLAGLAGFIVAASIGKLFQEAISYTQHYGLVRVDGAQIEPRHAWECHRRLSNSLYYNLTRHAHHHQASMKSFWELDAASNAPVLPYGYQTMALIAFIPPLWRRVVDPLLADWDRRLASEPERRVLQERGSA